MEYGHPGKKPKKKPSFPICQLLLLFITVLLLFIFFLLDLDFFERMFEEVTEEQLSLVSVMLGPVGKMALAYLMEKEVIMYINR